MKTFTHFMVKVFVERFYIINAGFLLFIFFIFFGMVNAGQLISYHQSLIQSVITSPVMMVVVWFAWLLFNIKCILFSVSTIHHADSGYIYTLKALPAYRQLLVYLLTATLQYMPVLAYAFFVVAMAVNRSLMGTALIVTIFQLLMLMMNAWVVFSYINYNTRESKSRKLLAVFTTRLKINLGYHWFLAAHIATTRKKALAIVKTFSLLLLSVSFIRNGDQFDEDLFGIFFQLVFVAHALLVFYCVEFSETWLQFSRNLPLPLTTVAGSYLLTYCILMAPELIFMLINNNGNLSLTAILLLYGTAVSVLFLYTAILYGCGLNMESYMLLVFVLFLMIFFLLKTGWPLLIMTGILVTAGIVLKSSYHRFERE